MRKVVAYEVVAYELLPWTASRRSPLSSSAGTTRSMPTSAPSSQHRTQSSSAGAATRSGPSSGGQRHVGPSRWLTTRAERFAPILHASDAVLAERADTTSAQHRLLLRQCRRGDTHRTSMGLARGVGVVLSDSPRTMDVAGFIATRWRRTTCRAAVSQVPAAWVANTRNARRFAGQGSLWPVGWRAPCRQLR